MMYGNPPSKVFLNRRRWAIEQQKRALAAASVHDYEAERAEKLAALRELAASLELLPHMAPTLAAVRTEIDRLVGSVKQTERTNAEG